uniref:Reverse transcriptase domain-containing protein n=1 Tax=Amphimedon queenslandica TaxID=400682 RepID=A0A1X7T6F5_AMPQE
MDKVIRGMERFANVYLDVIAIYCLNWEDHLQHIKQVFDRLRKAGLTVKLKKCHFATNKCTYLGQKVGNGCIWSEESKIIAVNNLPRPITKKVVMSFLKLTGYYRRFIENYATLAAPLTELSRKDIAEMIPWKEKEESALQELKNRLISTPIMKNPDFTKGFILQTDASGIGVGAVLSQSDDTRLHHYFSRKLLQREIRYSTVEQECLAIKLGI